MKHLRSTSFKKSELVEILTEMKPYLNPEFIKGDDLAFGNLFADVFKNVLRYNATSKAWYAFDGRVWKEDVGSMIAEDMSKLFQKALYCASVDAPKQFQVSVIGLGRRSNRQNMIKDAMSYNFITMDMLDKDDDLINLQNCILNLKTFETLEHDSKYLMSKIANVEFDDSARSEDFEKFFSEIMQDDAEKMRYLQKLLGYCLTAEVNREEMYFFYGNTTRNGKSTLVETIGNMLGDYTCSISPETLAESNQDGNKPNPEIARLPGIRFLRAPEPKKKMLFNVNMVKRMTGRDGVTVRNVFEKSFDFFPKYKLIINTNSLPVVTDETLFTGDRVRVITFDRHFEPEEQDLTLKDRLNTSESLSGVLNWCIEGLKLYREEGLKSPSSVSQATEIYRAKSDKLSNFLDECMTKTGKNSAGKVVYESYKKWCDESGMYAEKKGTFFDDLRAKGLLSETGTVDRKTMKNVIIGYQLIDDADSDFMSVDEVQEEFPFD